MILRIGLLATVFLSGAALMSLEMVSFRLVQPDLGSDIIVTGSLISVFLGGLALGAFLGGVLADRKSSLAVLGTLLLVAGAWTLILPLICDPVLAWVSPVGPAPAAGVGSADRKTPPPTRRRTCGWRRWSSAWCSSESRRS